jgi:hypothetical protein
MGKGHIHIALVACAIFTAVASAQQSTTQEQAEFDRLVHQRNQLYNELDTISAEYGGTAESETKLVQNRLDIIQQRLADLAVYDDLTIPRRPAPASTRRYAGVTGIAMAGPESMRGATASRRAEFKKLVFQRNKIHMRLSRLDEQAAELLKRGDKPLVVYARQVSAQDQLDLINLRLSLLSTRFGLIVPPVPGQGAAKTRGRAQPTDDMTRNLEKAFARGHDRAVKMLREDADTFMQSLDFWTFLND